MWVQPPQCARVHSCSHGRLPLVLPENRSGRLRGGASRSSGFPAQNRRYSPLGLRRVQLPVGHAAAAARPARHKKAFRGERTFPPLEGGRRLLRFRLRSAARGAGLDTECGTSPVPASAPRRIQKRKMGETLHSHYAGGHSRGARHGDGAQHVAESRERRRFHR